MGAMQYLFLISVKIYIYYAWRVKYFLWIPVLGSQSNFLPRFSDELIFG